MPVIAQNYDCSILTMLEDTTQLEDFTIENISLVMQITKAIFQVSSGNDTFVVLMPKAHKCGLFKIVKYYKEPTIGSKIIGDILTDIHISEDSIVATWKRLESEPVIRLNSIGNFLVAITNNTVYYCINCYKDN